MIATDTPKNDFPEYYIITLQDAISMPCSRNEISRNKILIAHLLLESGEYESSFMILVDVF
jgi:hypothetical protein